MIMERSEDEYSEEDYESSQSDEEDLNPFGGTTKANKNGGSTIQKKERIKRTGQVPLNMTRNYGRKSGWGVRQGIRELIQNFADNVRENPDGSLRVVDWVFEKTDNDQVHTFLAYAQGTKPIPNNQTGLHNRKMALGYITLRKNTATIILVNKNTSLSRRVWSMGETSKGGQEHHIGGHGEGMKVGIIALLHQGFEVTYFTNKEIWDWCFHDYEEPNGDVVSDLLTIQLSPYQPRKAKFDIFISDDVREARKVANKDTTVIVQGWHQLNINFNDYLFLVNPASETLLKTTLGTILTGDEYKSKIFVKGIFVEERGIGHTPPLAFGVDFNKAALDRDRRSLMTGSQIALTLAEMWDNLISEDQGTSAEMYLKLMLSKDDYFETMKAKDCISRAVAEKLFEKLRASFSPETFFYNKEDTNVSETLRIINECLVRVPESIPRRLYEIFLKYKLIPTAEEERRRLFSHASIATPDMLDPWIKHTLHAFESALQIHPQLKECSYVFRDAPSSVSIDIIRVTASCFEFHHRWLNYDYVHEQRMTCPLYQSKNGNKNQDKGSICYCAVEELMDLILPEIENLSATEKRQIERSYVDLLMTMPRDVSVTSAEDEEGIIRAEFNWNISATNYFGNFDIMIFPEDYGDSPRKEHRYHCMSRVVPPPGTNGPSTNTIVTPSTDLNTPISSPYQSPIDSPSTFGGSSPKSPLESVRQTTDFLWQGTAENSTSLALDISTTSSIVPGNKFVAIIRPALDNGCFYSLPFAFELPCPSPRKVEVEKLDYGITVSWEFLYPTVAKFRVTCKSSDDIIYTSNFISGQSHSFNIDDDLLTTELDVTVQAESNAGIRSEKISINIPAESMNSTSPSLDSICDDEDPVSLVNVSPTYQVESHYSPTISPPKSSRTYQPPVSKPHRRLNSESLLSEAVSMTQASKEGLEGKEDQEEMEDDELDSPNEAEDDFYDNMDMFSEDYTYARALSTPAPEQTSSDEELVVLNSATVPGFGTIEPGKAYHVVAQPGGAVVIHVHQIRRKSQEFDLVVSIYAFVNSLFGELPENATPEQRGELILFYTNWSQCGEIGDAVHLPLKTIVRVTESCRVQHPQQGPVGFDISTTEREQPTSGSERFYLVEWATAYRDWKCQTSPTKMRSLIELRSMHNRANFVELNSLDLKKLSDPRTVHVYDCGIGGSTVGFKARGFNVEVAVDSDRCALESWKKNHDSGLTFLENVDVFLDEYPQRVLDGVLNSPSVISMSNIRRVANDNCCGSYEDSCDSFKRVLRAATLVNSPLIMSEHDPKLFRSKVHHSKCWETLFKGLLKLGYEFSATVHQACDYDRVVPQSRLILVASKIGLPDIQGKSQVATVKERLQWKGFNEDYQLVGDIDTQIRQIHDALAPSTSKVIAGSVHKQIDAVKKKVAELQTEDCIINVNKRKRDENTGSGSPKKVRWRQDSGRE